MKITIRLLFGLALAFVTAYAQADPPARAGRLNYLSGTVSFAPAQSPDAWAFATLNRPLTSGDRLWADRDGYAEFHVGPTAVRLAPRTSLDILTLDDDVLQLRLAQGDVNVRLRELGDDTFEIATPSGAVLLEESGSYRLSVHPSDATTTVIVHSGRAHILTRASAFSVRAGEQVTLHGADGAASAMERASLDAFDRWSVELDRREDQIAATRYVSPHMTGYEDLDAHGTWRTMPEYGAVWVPRVSAGWAPYRHGHWTWIEPWGWTWIDDAPWGFAPFHYGRWVWLNGYWAWAPGPRIVRPVYAPALVAFVGGSNWSLSIGSGPAVGWFPLGWREPYLPWYRSSTTYVQNVNITHVRNVTVYNNVTQINYVNRNVPQAVTVVPRDAFVSARPVERARLRVAANHVADAPVVRSAPAEPVRESLAVQRAGARPPAEAIRREVVAARTPPARRVAEFADSAREASQPGRGEGRRPGEAAEEPRVRVLERARVEADQSERRARRSAREEPRASPEERASQAETSSQRSAPGPASERRESRELQERPRPGALTQEPEPRQRGRRSEDETPRQARPDREEERRVPGPPAEARQRAVPEGSPRAEQRAPGRPQSPAQPEVQREHRAPDQPGDVRPRARAEREPRVDRDVAPPQLQREHRAPPETRSRPKPEREPRAEREPAPQPRMQREQEHRAPVDARPRPKPEREPRAEREATPPNFQREQRGAPEARPPRAERSPAPQPRAEREPERRAPVEARPRPGPERERHAERRSAQPQPREHTRSDSATTAHERRGPPPQTRASQHEAQPRAPAHAAPQPRSEAPRPARPHAEPHYQARPQTRPPHAAPGAGGPPDRRDARREQRNSRD